MNGKFALTLLSSPALFASMISLVVMSQPASAGQNRIETGANCLQAGTKNTAVPRFVCQRSSKHATTIASQADFLLPQEVVPQGELNFTEEESDAAIAMFGCDCPACLNTLRQMRGMSQMAV